MSPHAWFLERLDLHRAGLLEHEAERTFARHAKECPTCARALAEYVAPEEDGAPGLHLSPIVLGAWPRALRDLRGLERHLTRLHLERCLTCREELEMLGYEPRLAADPALEAPADAGPWQPSGRRGVGRLPRPKAGAEFPEPPEKRIWRGRSERLR